MPAIIDKQRCNGCGACTELCPGDLLAIDEKTKKAYIRDARDCWECFSCVKACPRTAIEIVLPYSLAYYKASLTARYSKNKKTIIWILKKNGKKKIYRTKIAE